MNLIDKWKKAKELKKSDIDEVIRRIKEETEKVDPGSEEFRNLRYCLEQELKNKKLAKEIKWFGISPDKVIMIAVILVIAGFGFALDLESPKALKIAQFVLRMPIVKA